MIELCQSATRLTYIVVAVFHQEGNALAVDVAPAGCLVEAITGLADIPQQLSVLEPSTTV